MSTELVVLGKEPAKNIAGTPHSEVIVLGRAATVDRPAQAAVIRLGNVDYDISPLNSIFDNMILGASTAARNPLDPAIAKYLSAANQTLQTIRTQPLPTDVIRLIAPFATQLTKMQGLTNSIWKTRREIGIRLMQQPTIGIPCNLALSNVTPNSADIDLRNPYLGSGGNTSGAIWGITAFESPAGENIPGFALITKLAIAGHDYVTAALQGIYSWPGDLGRFAAPFRGFPLWPWSLSKIFRAGTEFRPWNLGDTPGIIGSIMRETGNVIIRFSWAGPALSTFNDTVMVWVRASPCGGIPFRAEDLMRVFVPLHEQARYATHLATRTPTLLNRIFLPNLNATLRGAQDVTSLPESTLEYHIPDLEIAA